VISNWESAPGLEIARQRGIPMRVTKSQGMERQAARRRVAHARRRASLSGGVHAPAERRIRARVSQPGAEHSSFAAARVPGPIVLRAAVPVLDNDTVDTLSARIEGRRVRIRDEAE